MGYTDTDSYGRVKNTRLLEILADVSMSHTEEEMGLPEDYMEQRGTHWVLYAWKVKLLKSDISDKKVFFTTFAIIEKEIYCYRYYIIKDEENNIIGYAFAHWIAIDIENRKLTKIPEDIREKIQASDIDESQRQKVIEMLNYKSLKRERNAVFDYERKIEVSYFDIDKNAHVNNAVYDRWALEALYGFDLGFLKHNEMLEFTVIYKKEKLEGGLIISRVKVDGDRSYHEILDEEGNLLAILEYKWKKIEE